MRFKGLGFRGVGLCGLGIGDFEFRRLGSGFWVGMHWVSRVVLRVSGVVGRFHGG